MPCYSHTFGSILSPSCWLPNSSRSTLSVRRNMTALAQWSLRWAGREVAHTGPTSHGLSSVSCSWSYHSWPSPFWSSKKLKSTMTLQLLLSLEWWPSISWRGQRWPSAYSESAWRMWTRRSSRPRHTSSSFSCLWSTRTTYFGWQGA